jgi:hypothetical protein
MRMTSNNKQSCRCASRCDERIAEDASPKTHRRKAKFVPTVTHTREMAR